jgi:hypothetical protein
MMMRAHHKLKGKLKMEKSPLDYGWLTYLWVMALSFYAGAVNHLRKIRDGTIPRFSISELIGDIVISGFLGVMTFFLCESLNFSSILEAFVVGAVAHMGTRGIVLLENIATEILKRHRRD